MQTNGFIIHRNTLSVEECERIKSHNLDSWNHSDIMWELRSHTAIKQLFADLWNVPSDDLLTSFDGIYHRKPHESFSLPWHMDHNASHPFDKMSSVQGILAMSNIDESTGGTQLLPGSHLRTKALCYRHGIDDLHDTWEFTEVPDDDRIFSMGLLPLQPVLQTGDVLLWDSRLLHRVVEPNDPATSRWTAYLSMVPRSMVSESVLKKRKDAFKKGIATTHWVQTFIDRGGVRSRPNEYLLTDSRVTQMVY